MLASMTVLAKDDLELWILLPPPPNVGITATPPGKGSLLMSGL